MDSADTTKQKVQQTTAQPGFSTPVEQVSNQSQLGDPRAKVMIVEDDPILLRMYTEKLTFEGFNVVGANNGEDALEIATRENPNLIILDIMLPRMSGTDFLERFRQTSTGKDIPVIALTNLAEDEERQRALKLGVKEYLVKAMQTPEQVLEKVNKYIS